jgi:sterol desaturase/sphingolipid hydroxylase (fatty acid hydroxylase superfamily)
MIASMVVRLYQVLLHNEYIGKLGFLEKILNTPSHHRVHHGRNEQYLDKNYGGIMILWDRLFGTFAEEQEKSGIRSGQAARKQEPRLDQRSRVREDRQRSERRPQSEGRLVLCPGQTGLGTRSEDGRGRSR